MESGIILSTGLADTLEGPNKADGYSNKHPGLPGDPDLNTLIPQSLTFDACVLEMEFACPAGTVGSPDVTFNYIFASDEYNEYVGSQFNDVFGFFFNDENIALVPDGKSTPVSINNVNKGKNSEYFLDNDPSDFAGNPPYDIQSDGFTTKLTAAAPVTNVAGTNKIKLAIGDVGDRVFNSWVLIEGGSFTCTTDFCDAYKGCHAQNPDKRSICHAQGRPRTLCLPVEAIAAHLEQHPNDYCGPCI